MLNLKAVQKELDLAAEELEKQGHKDLATKVDFYNDRLQRAASKEIPLIRRALQRIQIESARRARKDPSTAKDREAKRAAILERVRSRRARLSTPRPRRESRLDEIKERLAARRRIALRQALRNRRLASQGREEHNDSGFKDTRRARIQAALRARRNRLARQR